MTNRIIRNKQITRNDDDDEGGETYFSKAQSNPNLGGQYATDKPRHGKYPKLEGPLVSVPADHKFNPDRDRIEPENICSNTFGVALGGQSTLPETSPTRATLDGKARTNPPQPSHSFSRRRF